MNLDQLNSQQRRAVDTLEGPLLVLAGAGSGKTRVITHRIANLISNGVSPDHVLAVTFTNKAANEMKERTERLVPDTSRGLWCGTFHAICARLLRVYGEPIGLGRNFVVYDDADQKTLVGQILRDFSVAERNFAPKEVLWRIDRAKNEGITAAKYRGDDYFGDLIAEVYPEYQKRLRAANAVDFGDLLLCTVELLETDTGLAEHLSRKFRYLLVDEFQDTNAVQYALVRKLSADHHNLCVVGDDDQSIYSWRGADIRNILDFERDHPDATVIKLEQNYRSTQTILDAAGAVIRSNAGRKEKKLWTERGNGERIHYKLCSDEREEARWVTTQISDLMRSGEYCYGDVAIFYRTHAQSRVLEEALRAAHSPIPHALVGGVRFYDRAEVRDLIAYLRVMLNTDDDLSLQRIINTPARGIGATTLATLWQHARSHDCSLYSAIGAARSDATPLRTGPRTKLESFYGLIEALRQEFADAPPSAMAEAILDKTGYLERLAADTASEARDREENLMELVGSMRDYEKRTESPTLAGYLEQVTLASDVDSYSEDQGRVTLMTVHSAKGLEYPIVFLVGLEQGIFPHSRSLNDAEQSEEERRLAYVAITRAKDRLMLSHAQSRWLYGQQQVNSASEYLYAIPRELFAEGSAPIFGGGKRISGSSIKRSSNRAQKRTPGIWDDDIFDQTADEDSEIGLGFSVGMKVRHPKFGVGEVRTISGTPPKLNLTVYFRNAGPRTIRSDFVEVA